MATSSRSVSVRLTEKQLSAIDHLIDGDLLENRSRFMSRCARKQAKRVLSSKSPMYLPEDFKDDGSDAITITISLEEEHEKLIAAACTRLNQKLSPFLVWATLAVIAAANE